MRADEPIENTAPQVLDALVERSPVLSLAAYISQAPFRAAPEKAESLREMFPDTVITFLLEDGRFRAEAKGENICISSGALTLLWTASYCYWLLYQGYQSSQSEGKREYRPVEDPIASEAVRLYEVALRSTANRAIERWPATAPRPSVSPTPESPIAVANELFLLAVAWVCLHELGHIHARHSVAVTATAKAEEFEADAFATEWLLKDVSDELLLLKRSLGIAVANLAIVATDLLRGGFQSDTHPPSYERAHRNLRFRQLAEEHTVHAFVTVLLQFHLTVFGHTYTLEENASFDGFVDALCFEISKVGR